MEYHHFDCFPTPLLLFYGIYRILISVTCHFKLQFYFKKTIYSIWTIFFIINFNKSKWGFLYDSIIDFHFRIHENSIYNPKTYFIFIPALITLIIYLFHIHEVTGYYLGFKYISELNWDAKQSFPFSAIYNAIAVKEFNYLTYNAFYALFFFALSFRFLARKEFDFFLLCLLCILIPLYEGSTISQPRFISVIFPFSILIGNALAKCRYKVVILSLLLGLHLLSFHF